MSFGISIGDVLKLCELANRVYRSCRDCGGEHKSLTTEARSLTNLLEDIHDKYDKIPENKRQQLTDAYEPCVEVLYDLDKLLTHYNSLDTKTKRAWGRLKWEPETSRTLRQRLTTSVAMLTTFYTSLIHDSQVLIIEALEQLEADYRGGHREESIASIERITAGSVKEDDEDDDAAWNQILRDLEDLGVSQQEALVYREVIIDWLVAAVNEGRLLEQLPEPDSFDSLQQDLAKSLPADVQTGEDDPPVHKAITTDLSVHESSLVPFSPSPPLRGRSLPPENSTFCSASIITFPTFEWLDTSSVAPPTFPNHHNWPSPSVVEPTLPTHNTNTPNLSSSAIKRVPVPSWGSSDKQVMDEPPTHPTSAIPKFDPSTLPIPVATDNLLSPPSIISPTLIHLPANFPSQYPAHEPVNFTPPASLFAPPASVVASNFTGTSVASPPLHDERNTSAAANLEWTAHRIIIAWDRHDFPTAERLLEDQLAAVELGQTTSSGSQPDRRILRHLIGVCASFIGNFKKAKQVFLSIIQGMYLHQRNLDDGDIAAARWLGDVCLHLREHHNAVLAYGVAYEGCIGRYGLVCDRAQRIGMEIRLVDHWLYAFRRIEHSFSLNVDPTDIFISTHAVEKSKLLTTVKARIYEMNGYGHSYASPAMNQSNTPMYTIGQRAKLDLNISRGFLTSPLISYSTWPLPWDPVFSPMDAVRLDRSILNASRITKVIKPLAERPIPTNTFGDSRKLHFVTRRGSEWLIEKVKAVLQNVGIEHAEHSLEPMLVCCLNQHRDGFAFSEGVEILFRKLQFRNVYGIKITDAKWQTRRLASFTAVNFQALRDTSSFRNMVKSALEAAEMTGDVAPNVVPDVVPNAVSDVAEVEGSGLPSFPFQAPTCR